MQDVNAGSNVTPEVVEQEATPQSELQVVDQEP